MRREKRGFTLVELLTVLAIIAMLVGLLIPSLTLIRNNARRAKQKAQFTEIELALTAFRTDYGDYPPSYWMLPPGVPGAPGPGDYCGAQKLAEALLGWDLAGFHPRTAWRGDGYDATGGPMTYDPLKTRDIDADGVPDTLNERKDSYLERATENAFRLVDLYAPAVLSTSPLSAAPNTFVICDSFGIKKVTLVSGETVQAGTPILYYRANTFSKTIEAPALPHLRIYNARDNEPLTTQLGSIADSTVFHPLGRFVGGDYPVFYNSRFDYGAGIGYGIRDPKVPNPWPYRPDSYLLISAGPDGLYGTKDDVCNFGN